MFDKITSRISKLCFGLNMDFIDPVRQLSWLVLCHSLHVCSIICCVEHVCSILCCVVPSQAEITMKVISGVYSGVTTAELDTLAAETAASLITKHPDYARLAARIAVSNLHKETKKLFSGEQLPSATLRALKHLGRWFSLYSITLLHCFNLSFSE